MLFLIYGNDTEKAGDKAREIVSALQKKKPDATLVKVEGVIDSSRFDEFSQSQGLFENKFIVFLDKVCSTESGFDIVSKKIKIIAESQNVFVFLEGSLKAEVLKTFKKHSDKIQEFKKFEKKERFNAFLLAEAFSNKDKKSLWVLYRRALRNGLSPEELHGTIFWQAKTLMSVFLVGSASEAGLKPFSWTKAKSAIRNWKIEEIRKAVSDLVSVYHDARRGKFELETGLERFILEG
jgi:DNA polymerase III delta subunit